MTRYDSSQANPVASLVVLWATIQCQREADTTAWEGTHVVYVHEETV